MSGDHRDGSIRPNQIFAVSLHHKMLPAEMAKSVVQTVEQRLLTPYDLRSLAPGDFSTLGLDRRDGLGSSFRCRAR